MKTIGMLGGMSWESTALYYRSINQLVRLQLGGLHSAKIVMHSFDFQEIESLQAAGEWQRAGEILGEAARGLELAGADFLMICTNTMHLVAPQVSEYIQIPLLHLADATAKRLQEAGITKVGLLGTAYTMEQAFYKERIVASGIEVIVPDTEGRSDVNRIIFTELCLGVVNDESREIYLQQIELMRAAGVQAVIEGCTEITLLVQPQHTDMPLFDTTAIHAEEAVKLALLGG
ncbi:MAG TPA: aspartate/glutamate racemase [Oceanospirillaceae bacterium]|nr:aspartate/glutamate racemase [Oceanospirillaceae bacterium]